MTVQRYDLLCTVVQLYYDFIARTGTLIMGEGDCCDGRACEELFKKIDPSVRYIRTFAGREPMTDYHLSSDGSWYSVRTEQGLTR